MPVDEKTIMRVMFRDRAIILARIECIIRDPHLAEDIFQDVSMRALDKRSQINDESHLVRWISKACRDAAIDVYRKESHSPISLSTKVVELLDNEWQKHESLLSAEVTAALEKCVSKLSQYARRIVELRYREGLTGEKLAEAVGRSTNTVKVALTRIHRALLQCMRQQVGGTTGIGKGGGS